MISLIDQEIGRILDYIDQAGIADNTLIVFTTDHGHLIGQHGLIAKGAFHYEDLLRVPMLVRYPGHVPTGQVSDAIQSLVDYPQSFLAAAGIDAPGTYCPCVNGQRRPATLFRQNFTQIAFDGPPDRPLLRVTE